MNANEAIKSALDTAEMISMAYLEDLTDEEMMVRPIDSCNHIKWQVGHLITSENKMINSCCPGATPDLPAGFADRYAPEHSASGLCCDASSGGSRCFKGVTASLTTSRKATAFRTGPLFV